MKITSVTLDQISVGLSTDIQTNDNWNLANTHPTFFSLFYDSYGFGKRNNIEKQQFVLYLTLYYHSYTVKDISKLLVVVVVVQGIVSIVVLIVVTSGGNLANNKDHNYHHHQPCSCFSLFSVVFICHTK